MRTRTGRRLTGLRVPRVCEMHGPATRMGLQDPRTCEMPEPAVQMQRVGTSRMPVRVASAWAGPLHGLEPNVD